MGEWIGNTQMTSRQLHNLARPQEGIIWRNHASWTCALNAQTRVYWQRGQMVKKAKFITIQSHQYTQPC